MEAKNSNNLALLYLLGSSLIRDGQVQKGEVLVDRIISEGGPAEAHLLLGAAEAATYDTTGALGQLGLAIMLDPKLPLAHYLYGKELLATAGSRSEAMKCFREELAIDPNEFGSNLYLGVLLNQEHRFNEVMPYLQRAVEVRPGNAPATLQIAVAQIGMQQFEQAREALEALVKARPTFLAAHVSLATVYYRLHMRQGGDREEAIIRKLSAEAEAQTRAEGESHLPSKAANTSPENAQDTPP